MVAVMWPSISCTTVDVRARRRSPGTPRCGAARGGGGRAGRRDAPQGRRRRGGSCGPAAHRRAGQGTADRPEPATPWAGRRCASLYGRPSPARAANHLGRRPSRSDATSDGRAAQDRWLPPLPGGPPTAEEGTGLRRRGGAGDGPHPRRARRPAGGSQAPMSLPAGGPSRRSTGQVPTLATTVAVLSGRWSLSWCRARVSSSSSGAPSHSAVAQHWRPRPATWSGFSFLVVAVSVGVGALVERCAIALTILKFLGAAYLIWLGIQAYRHRGELTTFPGRGSWSAASRSCGARGLRRQGLARPQGHRLLRGRAPSVRGRHPTTSSPDAGSRPDLLRPRLHHGRDLGRSHAAGTARDWFASSPTRLRRLGGAGGLRHDRHGRRRRGDRPPEPIHRTEGPHAARLGTYLVHERPVTER